MIKVRKGQAPPPLSRAQFGQRFRLAYVDPAFKAEQTALERLSEVVADQMVGRLGLYVTRTGGR
jgi:hypothetical protein